MAFAGIRSTSLFANNERPKNWRETILWLEPNGMTPLQALLATSKSEKTDDPEFGWFEEKLAPPRVVVTTAMDNNPATTTFTCAGGGVLQFVPNDILLVEGNSIPFSNEAVMVSTIISDTQFVGKRGSSGSAPAAIPNPTGMFRYSTAFPENSGTPLISMRNPTDYTNNTQIFRTAVGLSRTTSKTKIRTGNSWENDKRRKLFDHSNDVEYTFMFGRKYATTDPATGMPLRFTGGLRYYLTYNNTTFGATPTMADYINSLVGLYSTKAPGVTDERLVLAGQGYLMSLNNLIRKDSSVRMEYMGVIDKAYGMELFKFNLPIGRIFVKTHPLMTLNPVLNNSGFIVVPSLLRFRYIDDTQFTDNLQQPGTDGKVAGWLTEAGIEVNHPEVMGVHMNFNVAA